MAISKVGLTTGITGTLPVANGGTGLASGTTDQFLKFTGTTTLASAADNAGSMVHLQTSTLGSDASKIEFSNVFSTTYKSYLFVFNQLKSTATSGNFISRLFSDTGTTSYTSSNYEVVNPTGRGASGSSGTSGSSVFGTAYFGLINEVFHQNTPGSGYLYVHNPRDSSNRLTISGVIGLHDGTNHRVGMVFGMVTDNAEFYGMEFLTTSPNLGSGTSISLYGLTNS